VKVWIDRELSMLESFVRMNLQDADKLQGWKVRIRDIVE